MRFKKPKIREHRIRKNFAWLPITLPYKDGCEMRWLEFVYIDEMYDWNYVVDLFNWTYHYWDKQRFVDKEDYDEFCRNNNSKRS